jgi:DNA polymerase III epsilon subunit family exonuclease
MIITVIDTETTGFSMINHEIIEIGVLRVDSKNGKFKILDQLEYKIMPEHIELASPHALKVNGYSTEAWQSAARFVNVADELKKFIESGEFHLGQNLVFDYRFINKAYNQCGKEPPKYKKYFDTKLMADGLVHDKKLERSGLDFLCEHYKIKNEGRAHTALTDCKRTLKLFQKLSKDTKPTLLEFSSPFDPYKDKDVNKQQ